MLFIILISSWSWYYRGLLLPVWKEGALMHHLRSLTAAISGWSITLALLVCICLDVAVTQCCRLMLKILAVGIEVVGKGLPDYTRVNLAILIRSNTDLRI